MRESESDSDLSVSLTIDPIEIHESTYLRETGGAVRFVNFLATHAGSSMGERRAFVSFALQRLRCATVKGACALINERSPSGGGPSRSCRGLLPLPEPKGRPAATRTRAVPGTHPGAPPPRYATTFPTPPPFPQPPRPAQRR